MTCSPSAGCSAGSVAGSSASSAPACGCSGTVEADPYCRAVLEHHWPGVPCYPDVRELRGADVEPVDVLCGGFPCQDISVAGRGAGIAGARSGLWSEYARLIGELRPRYVLVENVSALLVRGLDVVLGDLAALGLDAEWDCLPASAFGAPHQRDRLWLVAYPQGGSEAHEPRVHHEGRALVGAGAGADGRDQPGDRAEGGGLSGRDQVASGTGVVADTDGEARDAAGCAGETVLGPETLERSGRCGGGEGSPWAVEPDVGRVAYGVPARSHRLAALGNALVPAIAQWIGERIIEWEGGLAA